MYIANRTSVYINKYAKYCSNDEARNYRNNAQRIIDDEDFNDTISVGIIEYRLSGECNYGLHLSGSLEICDDETIDTFCSRYEELNDTMNKILNDIGISETES